VGRAGGPEARPSGGAAPEATDPLTEANRSAGREGIRQGPPKPPKLPGLGYRVCARCGVVLEGSGRKVCPACAVPMVAERRFRRLNAPHLLAKVYAGVRYVDGVEATQEVAA
jgi:hypothetical protein